MGSALPELLSLPTAACDADAQSLQRYLRLLWNLHPPLHVDAETPFIDGHSIHLVPAAAGGSWWLQRAAAAHAAAHLVYSPPVFDGRGLGPIVRALMGMLEDALLRARVALRLRVPVDGRVYRRPQRMPGRGRVLVLIDRSVSSADPWDAPGHSRLQAACDAAHLLAQAAQAAGLRTRVDAFCSNGRHAVRVWRLKDVDEPGAAALQARLHLLTPLGSTRLGAALRHAAAALGQRDGNSRLVKQGMQTACRVFGAQRAGAFRAMQGLPGLLRRLAR